MRSGKILNITKYHEYCFLPYLMLQNVRRVCLKHNSYSLIFSKITIHQLLFPVFSMLITEVPIHKEQTKIIQIINFLQSWPISHCPQMPRYRLTAYIVINLSRLKLRHPPTPRKLFCIQVLNWVTLRPLKSFCLQKTKVHCWHLEVAY